MSKKCHSAIFITLTILLCLQVIIGLALLLACESVKYSLLKYLNGIQRNEVSTRIFILEMFGLHLIIFYMCGIPLAKKAANESFTDHLKLMLLFWNGIILMTSLEGLITSWVCYTSLQFVEMSIKESLHMGIDVYYTDTNWRLLWDNLQIDDQCCGVESWKDWETFAWMESQNEDNEKELSQFKYVSSTPYSCCRYGTECYRDMGYADPLSAQQKTDLPKINATYLYHNGCLDVVVLPISTILTFSTILVGVVAVLQVGITILMSLQFTSNRYYSELSAKNEEENFPECDSSDKSSEEELRDKCDTCHKNIVTFENRQ